MFLWKDHTNQISTGINGIIRYDNNSRDVPRRVSTFVLIGDGQFAPFVCRVVLYQRVHYRACGGEIGNLIGFSNNKLSVQDIVIGIIASVDDKREIHHQSCCVALTVGTRIRFVGRDAVIGQKFCFSLAIYDKTAAGALNVWCNIKPTTDEIKFLILHGVRVDGNAEREQRLIGVLRIFFAAIQDSQAAH